MGVGEGRRTECSNGISSKPLRRNGTGVHGVLIRTPAGCRHASTALTCAGPYSSQHLQEYEVPESPSDVKSRFHLSRVIRNELPPGGSF